MPEDEAKTSKAAETPNKVDDAIAQAENKSAGGDMANTKKKSADKPWTVKADAKVEEAKPVAAKEVVPEVTDTDSLEKEQATFLEDRKAFEEEKEAFEEEKKAFNNAQRPVEVAEDVNKNVASPATPTTVQTVVQVVPKVRFVGNPKNELLIMPDLKNEIDEGGCVIKPGQKIDLLMYYTPQEINRSRGLDSFLSAHDDPIKGDRIPPKLLILESLDVDMGPLPPTFLETHKPGTVLEANRNYADDNLDELDARERKELEKASRLAGKKS